VLLVSAYNGDSARVMLPRADFEAIALAKGRVPGISTARLRPIQRHWRALESGEQGYVLITPVSE
jgi:hypothetical protein